MQRSFMPLTFIVLVVFCTSAWPKEKAPEEGFQPLFNGKDLKGWKVQGGKMDAWGVDKGLLFTTGTGGGWLLTDREFSDYEMRLEYRWEKPGGNSGVAVRAPLTSAVSSKGIEIQLIDDAGYEKVHHYKLKPTQHTGSIYGIVPPSKLPGKGAGEWNKMRIVAKGRRITVELNGVIVTDANLGDYKDKTKEHPGLLRTQGHVGVQSHGGRVEFRGLRIKQL
jgi:hypothetical protein